MPKIINIHVITRLELGGAQQNTLYTVSHLNPARFETYLICGKGGLLDKEAALLGDHVFFVEELKRAIHPVFDLKALFKIRAILRKLKKRHLGLTLTVHTHSSKGGIIGRAAAFFSGISLIVHTYHGFGFHGGQNKWVRLFYIFLEKLAAKITRQQVFVSRDNMDQAAALGMIREPAALIRSGIPFRDFKKPVSRPLPIKKELNLSGGVPLVTMVACFKPQKAPLDFVAMAHEVSRRFHPVHFLMIGDGELRPAIEIEIKRLQLDRVISLLGWRRDIPDLLASSDIFVLSSLWEGLPRVFIEARLSGLPIVTTHVEGACEMVENEKTGFIVPKKDYLALAEKVIYLLRNPALARKMGELGKSVPIEYDIDEMVCRQEKLYLNLVEKEKY